MRKVSSEPNVRFHTHGFVEQPSASSLVPAPRALASGETCELKGDIMLKATPGARNELRAVFVGTATTLKIVVRHAPHSMIHDSVVLTLSLATLFVGRDCENANMFCIGAKWKGCVYHHIYCYPCTLSRGLWLRFLMERGCEIVSMPPARRVLQSIDEGDATLCSFASRE